MNITYAEKTAARLIADTTGVAYQKALTAIRSRDLSGLAGGDITAEEIVDVVAGQLHAALAPELSLPDVRVVLYRSTIAEIVRRHHPNAVTCLVRCDDEEPQVGYLSLVVFADGAELDGTWGEPVADEAYPWCVGFAGVIGLPPDDLEEITWS